MTRRSWCTAATAVALLAAGVPVQPLRAQAPASARVLVMPFSASVDAQASNQAGATLWLGQAMSVLLVDDLTSRGVAAVSRDEAARAFDRLKLPLSSSLTRATMIRVGELLGCGAVVFGEVRLGERLSVHARMIRLDTASLRPDVSSDGAFADMFAVAARVGDRLSADLAGKPMPLATTPAPQMPVPAFENYMKGLVAATPAAQQRFLENAMKLVPRDPRVLLALWATYTAEDNHDKALAVASGVPRESPLSRRARFSAALSLIGLGRLEGAFQELTALHTERPAAPLSNALGLVQLRRGSPAGGGTAVFFFRRAATEEPGNADYLFNLGYANALAAQADDALTWLRESVRVDAANGDAHLVMSAVLTSTGRGVEARRELELARLLGVSVDPVPATSVDKVPAGLVRPSGDLDAVPLERTAASGTGPAQRDQQEAAAFQLGQGRKLFEAESDREAALALRRAIYLAPYEDEPHLLLGRIYQRGGRLQEAIDEFKVALWCRDSAAAHVALGSALLDTGDKDGARREAERALAMERDRPDARALLKRIGGDAGRVLPSVHFHG